MRRLLGRLVAAFAQADRRQRLIGIAAGTSLGLLILAVVGVSAWIGRSSGGSEASPAPVSGASTSVTVPGPTVTAVPSPVGEVSEAAGSDSTVTAVVSAPPVVTTAPPPPVGAPATVTVTESVTKTVPVTVEVPAPAPPASTVTKTAPAPAPETVTATVTAPAPPVTCSCDTDRAG
jgi:hypothetical protein